LKKSKHFKEKNFMNKIIVSNIFFLTFFDDLK